MSDTKGGGLAMVEHVLAPLSLAAPVHRHRHEDEYSFVTKGRIAVQLGDELVEVRAGEGIAKLRGVPHTFWNPAAEEARLLEVIRPAGFETFFHELAAVLAASNPPRLRAIREILQRYDLEMDLRSAPVVMERHGLVGGPVFGAGT